MRVNIWLYISLCLVCLMVVTQIDPDRNEPPLLTVNLGVAARDICFLPFDDGDVKELYVSWGIQVY